MMTPPATRQALGPPLGLTDDEIDALCVISPADVKKAAALWRTFAPPWAKDLIDAQPAV
jgi:hypothetical protein